jgi:hypothetical protein
MKIELISEIIINQFHSTKIYSITKNNKIYILEDNISESGYIIESVQFNNKIIGEKLKTKNFELNRNRNRNKRYFFDFKFNLNRFNFTEFYI